MRIIKMCIVVVALLLLSIVFTGLSELSKSRDRSERDVKSIGSILKVGTCKVISSITIAIITAGVSALLLSLIIKPSPQSLMPAFAYDGTYTGYNISGETEYLAEMILSDAENRIAFDPESAYYDMAYAYFSSSNFDLAAEALEECYELNPRWQYAYDLGVSYGYMMDYRTALRYLNHALELDPPVYDRGVIVETISMLENYSGIWLSRLFKLGQ